MSDDDLIEYRKQIREQFKKIAPIFAKAAIGDFSHDAPPPKEDDDPQLAEFIVGIQIILDAVREKETENRSALNRLEIAHRTAEHEKALYRAMLSSVAEGLIVVDNNAHITLINQAAADMLVIDRTAAVGSNYYDIVVTHDRNNQIVPIEDRPLHLAITKGLERITTVTDGLQYIRTDGTPLPVAITASPVVIGKEIIGAVSTFRDVSAEQQLDGIKSEIISLASHQLRTPLTAVEWMSEELTATKIHLTKAKQKRYLKQIHSSSVRMVNLINDLLNVSKLELGKMTYVAISFDLKTLVADTLRDVTPLLKSRQIRLEKHISPEFKIVDTDPNYLRVILQNLLSNAIKYSPNGETVTLEIEPRGPNMYIVVSDHGFGIPSRQQSRVFGKLFRADNAQQAETDGSGLGLYLSRAMAEQAGGRIWFDSVEDKGTTFYVTLPLIQHSSTETTETKPASANE